MPPRNQRLELTWYNKDKALISAEEGKYKYRWVERNDPRYCQTRPIVVDENVVGTQTPKDDKIDYSERADFTPTDDNLLIVGESGDALEALTRIPEWSDKYLGQVKLVYIDPPFNTQNMFKDYDDNLEHSVWLTMMRDRLYHLKDLLSHDGSIWVHLDNQENHRMRLLLDEVFGAGNFVAEVVWQKTYSPKNDSKRIPTATDQLIVFRRSDRFSLNGLPRTVSQDSRYANQDDDPRPWSSGDAAAPGAASHQGMVYAIQHPQDGRLMYPSAGRHWSWGQDDLLKVMSEWAEYQLEDIGDEEERARLCGLSTNEIRQGVQAIMLAEPLSSAQKSATQVYESKIWPEWYFTNKGMGGLRRKKWLDSVKETVSATNLWFYEEVGHTDSAKKEIKALFPDRSPFDTPKPERLLERIIHIATTPGDIVMDMFAGSGTTAAVAHKMGRRWVTAELQSDTVEHFTLPRLTKVVHDQDPGGVTQIHGYIAHPATGVKIPDKNSAQDFREATTLLNRIIKQEGIADGAVETLKGAVKLLRTEKSGPINWRGGGSFQVAHLAPACFDYDPEINVITLTPAATGETLVNAVAAQLKFERTNDDAFDGRKGNARLIVVDGFVTTEIVDDLVAMLQPGETLALAATAIDDGVREHLRKECRGSVVYHVPDDLFHITNAMKGGDDQLHLADPDTLNAANAENGDKK